MGTSNLNESLLGSGGGVGVFFFRSFTMQFMKKDIFSSSKYNPFSKFVFWGVDVGWVFWVFFKSFTMQFMKTSPVLVNTIFFVSLLLDK